MGKLYKLFCIVVIFSILQVYSVVFTNNTVYAEGFFDGVFSSGKKWKEMQESSGNKATAVNNGMKVITDTKDEIYDTIKVIGGAIFMLSIAGTMIAINMKDKTGKDIAGLKTTLVFTFVLALLFIFSDKFIGVVTGLFESLEKTM